MRTHNNSATQPPLSPFAKGGSHAPLRGGRRCLSLRARTALEDRLVRMQQGFRKGATLTEVLIALLIMSIGLVALAVLFPISVLRSIKATQFTTATDNRYNAEA